MNGRIVEKQQCQEPCDCSAALNRSRDGLTKGRILRLKQGYNPNSSSMGSIVFALPAALFGVTIGFGFVSGIITSAFVKKDKQDRSKRTPDDMETIEGLTAGEESRP